MHMMENNNKNNQQPQPWPPYYSQPQDCSQGYCSYYCPQFCFFLFPPPPPPSPSPHLLISPILIAVIAIVSAAFFLVAYYIILTAYRRRHSLISSTNLASPENHPAAAAAWHPSHGAFGLDDSLIEKIAACRYQSGTGLLVDGTDCSVCLSSFEDGDRIRFLPKCSHAFHVPCIDTWLKSHSNCPLCRAGVLPLSLLPPPDPTSAADHQTSSAVAVVVQEPPNETSAVQVDLGHDIVEIDVEGRGGRLVGRSLSMDFEANSNCDMMSPVRLNRSWSMRSSTSSGRRRSEVLPT